MRTTQPPAHQHPPAAVQNDLVPPVEILFDGTTSREEFIRHGEGFTSHFLIQHGALQSGDRVLDLGCGIGQKARVLSTFLNSAGSYEGLDIVRSGIEWCQKAYRHLPNFQFQLADVYSKHYNPFAQFLARDYRLPFVSGEFDFVFLSSVFTHMLPPDVENYFSEISRVLKPGGRSVITFFLLNAEALNGIGTGRNVIKVPHTLQEGVCRIADPTCPEITVAYDEPYIRSLYQKHEIHVVEISYGFWCGRKDIMKSLQDVIIGVKG
ncbi:MAG: class I SAM-dependent methyltransferase [Pseudomonadota bacterium]|nr:class I SAM-dependent methyltransferase [Gammaproteobacteria bacterium]MDQ3581822.1 class I SAM-dependent methyltransferase [Pseudomonadota bacterium]